MLSPDLLHENLKVWQGNDGEELQSNVRLDSSIKKNSGFLKKIKLGLNQQSVQWLLEMLEVVSLEKYESELLGSLCDVLGRVPCKGEDVDAAVTFLCALHKRFNGRITTRLQQWFLVHFDLTSEAKNVDSNTKEDQLRVQRYKGLLRIYVELTLMGMFKTAEQWDSGDPIPNYLTKTSRQGKAVPFICAILREILQYRFKTGQTVTVATFFVKTFPELLDKIPDTAQYPYIVENALPVALKTLYEAYIIAVRTRYIELLSSTDKLRKDHEKGQILTGRATNKYTEEFNQVYPIFERFQTGIQSLSAFFRMEVPHYGNVKSSPQSPVTASCNAVSSSKIWNSDEERRFYEVLPDFNHSTEIVKSRSYDVGMFFEELDKVENCETIDTLYYEYWKNDLNNKATEKRLMRYFFENKDYSKIRWYARFIAANETQMSKSVLDLVNQIDEGIRNQIGAKTIDIGLILIYCELTKFMLVPGFRIFHKIRSLLKAIAYNNNIDVLTIILEHTGKFLLNKPQYKEEMDNMVNLLREKRNDKNLDIFLRGSIDNLMAMLYPPTLKSLNNKKPTLTPLQQFYRILIRTEIANFDIKRIINLVRKADWEDKDIQKTFFSLFTKPHKVNFENIPLLAHLLRGIYNHRREFVIKCIDQIFESIEMGLELFEPKYNLERTATVRYLIELFNYELIKSQVLVKTMLYILRYGHIAGVPNPAKPSDMDPPDNYFRIQLISVMLLNLKRMPSSLKPRMELLVRFFEYYAYVKQQPLPAETQFKVESVFSRYSDELKIFERASSFQECFQKLQVLVNNSDTSKSVANKRSTNAIENPIESSDDESSPSDEEYDDYEPLTDSTIIANVVQAPSVSDIDSISNEDELDSSDYSEDSSENEGEDSSNSDTKEDFDDYDDMVVNRDTEKRKILDAYERELRTEEEIKAQQDMEKQYQLMLYESLNERKTQRNDLENMRLAKTSSADHNSPNYGGMMKNEKVAFRFLSKSGKKTQSQVLDLPNNVKFVSDVLEGEARLKDERQRIKQIVMQLNFD